MTSYDFVVLGAKGAGKSALVIRYTQYIFVDEFGTSAFLHSHCAFHFLILQFHEQALTQTIAIVLFMRILRKP